MKAMRGTYDLFDESMDIHNYVLGQITEVVKTYDFRQIKTPIFESTDLFRRTSGVDSDVVQKEMYEFEDKGGRSITLRPELTAGVARAFLSNKIYGKRLPQYKYYYYGEAFRYERPQKGRFRQFYQFGVEMFGEDQECSDAEIISLAVNTLKHLGLYKHCTLKINTIGSSLERKLYNEKLREYFSEYKDVLCEDCQNRIETNPLRILDCKVDSGQGIIKNSPRFKSSLGEETLKKYEMILLLLDGLGIEYEEDDSLVRGLDYYNDIVFEIIYKNDNEEKTLIGGGRYDSLMEQLGGPTTPAIGFGIGIERVIDAMQEKNLIDMEEVRDGIDIYFMPQTKKAFPIILNSMDKLRKVGLVCGLSYEIRSIKSQFKEAENKKALFVVIIDEDNLENNEVKVKNLINKEESIVKLEDFVEDIMNEMN